MNNMNALCVEPYINTCCKCTRSNVLSFLELKLELILLYYCIAVECYVDVNVHRHSAYTLACGYDKYIINLYGIIIICTHMYHLV